MKHALVSGGRGFVGRAIVRALRADGYEVDTLGRGIDNDIIANLSVAQPPLLRTAYDLVVHAAGKAHSVPRTEPERASFFAVNATGTSHLLLALDALERCPEAIVLISTVAVYGCEVGEELREGTPLAAADPYGQSKIQAERLVEAWGQMRGVRVGVLRLPLVAGPEPPGNLGAMIRGIQTGAYVSIGQGDAKRSVVLADDVAEIVPAVAAVGGTYHLAGASHPSFRELEIAIAEVLGRSAPRRVPVVVARAGAALGDSIVALTGLRLPLTSRTLTKMTSTLTFDDAKARSSIGWAPRSVLETASLWAGGTANP